MKRKDLIDEIERLGCILIRHGAKHAIYHKPKTGIRNRYRVTAKLMNS